MSGRSGGGRGVSLVLAEEEAVEGGDGEGAECNIKINHRIYTYRKWLEFAFKQTNWSNPTQWEGIILQGVTASGTHLEGGCCFHYTYLTTFKTHGMNPWEELLCSGMQISTAECKGAKLMLLKNFEVELGLWMEPVEQWWTFATKNAMGRAQMQMKLNMEVCFTMKICSMLLLTFQLVQYQRVRNSLPTNLTPHTYIPLAEERCDRKCCSVRASPLSCCKALSIHNKSQGMTVGPAQARHLSISLCITQL